MQHYMHSHPLDCCSNYLLEKFSASSLNTTTAFCFKCVLLYFSFTAKRFVLEFSVMFLILVWYKVTENCVDLMTSITTEVFKFNNTVTISRLKQSCAALNLWSAGKF